MMICRISVILLYFNWHKHEATKSMYSKGNRVDFLNGKLCWVKRELIVSLRNETAKRRGRQNACVWQTWQCYYLRVLSWSSLTLMFSGLLQKDLFKGGWSSAKRFFKQNYCHACHTGFTVVFPLPSCCVSSLKQQRRLRLRKLRLKSDSAPPLIRQMLATF